MVNHIKSPVLSKKSLKWLCSLKGIPGWLSSSSAFISICLAQYQRDMGLVGDVAEIGVYHGKYLVGLATSLSKGEVAIAVDLFEDQKHNCDLAGYDELGSDGIYVLTKDVFLQNLSEYAPNSAVCIIQQSSLELSERDFGESQGNIRFFSIDGGHSIRVFSHDLRLAERSIAPHGIISIDDILNAQWPGIVTSTIRHLDGESMLRPVAFIQNKLLCAFEPYVGLYKSVLKVIAPKSLQRTNVEFSRFVADLYVDGPDLDECLRSFE